jgi:LuxR family maltose regulon positive regulatory protein
LVLQALGEGDQALVALERALSLAEPEGYVRAFIGESAPMGELLRRAAARGIRLDYVGKLLAALESETADEQQASRLAPLSLVEPLSGRELEVLRLLTTHLSSTQIAQELVISVSTVRSHVKNIYGKLNVHTRADAVRRAKELGLL